MGKRLTGIVMLLLLIAAAVYYFAAGGWNSFQQAVGAKKQPMEKLEETLKTNFPSLAELRRLQVSLSYLGGSKEQNGVYITGDSLMLDVQPKSQDVINDNMLAILDFAEDSESPCYVMLIPTACVIQQSSVPYADVAPLYDQKKLIDDVYRRVSGRVTAIDVYPSLFNHQSEYIYYKTDNTITGLGGYYIYTVAAQKLGLKPRGIEEFEVEHLDYHYYGDLYQLSPYREVDPDRVSAYIFSKYWRSYTLTHYDGKEARRYYTLYPKFKKELGSAADIILGGMSPIIDIEIGNPQYDGNNLLIFGDRSIQGYLPFLLIHYGHVTVVDMTQVTPEILKQVDVSDYTQVLFAYSVDNFVTNERFSVLPKPTSSNR